MADEFERASGYEQDERERAAAAHAAMMAALKPANECKHCGDELQPHRKPWASCIECAEAAEKQARAYAR